MFYSNNKNSGAISHAKKYQIPFVLLKEEDLSFSSVLVNELNRNQIHLIVLAGFLLKIPRKFIEGFKNPDFLSFLRGEGATRYGK